MFIVHDLGIAVLFCVVTMLGWGSWANTQKLAGKDQWPFELFYWDYAIGVFVFSLLFAFTLGSAGSSGVPFLENFRGAAGSPIRTAIWSGVLFNISNILLVVGIDEAGMAVAFPVGVGLALVIGTVKSYVLSPQGSAALLTAGVVLIVFAMIMSALAHHRLKQAAKTKPFRGLAFSAVAGCLMGFFYPELVAAVSPDFTARTIQPGLLTPYTALVLFAVGLLASNIVVNYDLHACGPRHLRRLLSRTRPAAFAGVSGRMHLDAGAEYECDCFGRGWARGLLRAGPGRDAGGCHLGRVHLARVPARAEGDVDVRQLDVRGIRDRAGLDRNGQRMKT